MKKFQWPNSLAWLDRYVNNLNIENRLIPMSTVIGMLKMMVRLLLDAYCVSMLARDESNV